MEQNYHLPHEDGDDMVSQERRTSDVNDTYGDIVRASYINENPTDRLIPVGSELLNLSVGRDEEVLMLRGRWMGYLAIELAHEMTTSQFDQIETEIKANLSGRDPMVTISESSDALIAWFNVESANDELRLTVTKFAQSIDSALGLDSAGVLEAEIAYVDTSDIDYMMPEHLKPKPYGEENA